MVSQRTANAPRGDTRLGSIPRISAKGCQVRYSIAALVCKTSSPSGSPSSNLGAPTKFH